ncbi:MAG: bifunctional glycosyltransferase family 2 protein/CDP-glycerol:glycerophosphate glycerophosphotransferase [Lachnospiraceae bacterium]|nr:bifunctional glycosyltransferase family 2 protein/CDP-glycerol:glycerophosphate glycerophosphotransferase [Lachnospiraceae bacterium]
MLISLIVPIKKGRDYLKDCFASLIEQDFTDYETILVLDHPEEDFTDIIDEYGKSINIRVLNNTGKEGVAAARNLGIKEAKGEYIMFLDSDDYLYRGALSALSSTATEDEQKKPDLVYGKKVWTWYTRAGFLSTFEAEKLDADDDTSGENSEEEEANDSDAESERDQRIAAMTPEEYEDFEIRRGARRMITKRKGIRNVSVLGALYKKDVILENDISFNEDFRFYSDLSFLCIYFDFVKCCRRNYDALYIKRKHGDPIRFPSLAQEKSEFRFDELLSAYKYTRNLLKDGSPIIERLDKKFIHYYTDYYVKMVRRSENDMWRDNRYDQIREVFAIIPKETIKCLKLYRRRHVYTLLKGDVKKTHRIVSFHLFWKKLGKILKNKNELGKVFYKHVFSKMPVKQDWVLFECFFAKSYGDNPKGIYEYMAANHGDEYKFIWSLDKNTKIPYKHKKVKRFSIRYAYYIARCKYFVFNTHQPGWMIKREGQIFLETWHGTPLKRLAFDMEDNFSASPGYKKAIFKYTRDWDYLVSANSFSSECFKSCFLYEGNMLEFGYPRNDILHSPDREEKAVKIRKKLGIPEGKKTILYAPTWRDDEFYEAGQYKFTLKLDLPKMKAALGDEYVLLLRTHYYIADKIDVTGMEGFTYNLSKYDDIADIYLISDICITDYSSVFFDYANLKRPLLFYTYDIEKYRGMLRGFYIDMESTVPGPLLYTTEEVIDAVKNIDSIQEKYADTYDRFYDRFCGWENGNASENIYNKVFVADRK